MHKCLIERFFLLPQPRRQKKFNLRFCSFIKGWMMFYRKEREIIKLVVCRLVLELRERESEKNLHDVCVLSFSFAIPKEAMEKSTVWVLNDFKSYFLKLGDDFEPWFSWFKANFGCFFGSILHSVKFQGCWLLLNRVWTLGKSLVLGQVLIGQRLVDM